MTVEKRDEFIYHAAVLPGFWLAVDWLWEDPLPSAMEILKQIKGS
jgi:hypothetical protein